MWHRELVVDDFEKDLGDNWRVEYYRSSENNKLFLFFFEKGSIKASYDYHAKEIVVEDSNSKLSFYGKAYSFITKHIDGNLNYGYYSTRDKKFFNELYILINEKTK